MPAGRAAHAPGGARWSWGQWPAGPTRLRAPGLPQVLLATRDGVCFPPATAQRGPECELGDTWHLLTRSKTRAHTRVLGSLHAAQTPADTQCQACLGVGRDLPRHRWALAVPPPRMCHWDSPASPLTQVSAEKWPPHPGPIPSLKPLPLRQDGTHPEAMCASVFPGTPLHREGGTGSLVSPGSRGGLALTGAQQF